MCLPIMKTMQLTSSGNEDVMFVGARHACGQLDVRVIERSELQQYYHLPQNFPVWLENHLHRNQICRIYSKRMQTKVGWSSECVASPVSAGGPNNTITTVTDAVN